MKKIVKFPVKAKAKTKTKVTNEVTQIIWLNMKPQAFLLNPSVPKDAA